METIDPPAKIPPPLLEKPVISQRTEDREPQRQPPGPHGQKKGQVSPKSSPEEKETGRKMRIDILV